MSARLETLQRLGTLNCSLRRITCALSPTFLPIIPFAGLSQREKKRKAKQDPYKWAQAQQRKNKNLARRAELQKIRDEAWGNPIWGKPTSFVESLDTAALASVDKDPPALEPAGQESAEQQSKEEVAGAPSKTEPLSASVTEDPSPREKISIYGFRNHSLTEEEIEAAGKYCYVLTKPLVGSVTRAMDAGAQEKKVRSHEEQHVKKMEAIRRITSLENSSAKDLFRINVRRIVENFGRHNTDKVLTPRPRALDAEKPPKMPGRIGPDTGSSEVQIAIFTARIRALAKALENEHGHRDKQNQRALRLLVHKRQKLLRYMEKRERGGERWTHMLETLGLTPATWKGQITI